MEEEKNKGKKKDLKVILLGDSGVGKSSIILRYYKNQFDQNGLSTFGAAYVTREIVKDDITYRLNIWDTSGQEKYRAVTKLFVQGANIVILVYSIDRKDSFDILDFWYQEILKIAEGENNFILGIAGNKSDLIASSDKETIPEEEGEKYAKEKNAYFKLLSAKEDYKGIENFFNTLLDKCIENNIGTEVEDSFQIKKKNTKKGKKNNKGCC